MLASVILVKREWDISPLSGSHVEQIMPCALAHGSSPDPVLSPLLYPPTCGSLVCGELGVSVLPPVPIRDYLDHRGCRGSNIFSDVWHEGMTVVSVYSMGNEGLSVSPHGSKRHSLTVGFAVLQH